MAYLCHEQQHGTTEVTPASMSSRPSSFPIQKPPLRVAVLTTSFPLTPTAASGAFVLRLVQNLPSSVAAMVITPSGVERERLPADANYQMRCFRYAPRAWQQLAHQPGGIPAALKQRRSAYLLLPLLLGAMFWACLRAAREVDLIHANWSVNGIIAGIVGRLARKPVITTLRGQDVNRSASSWTYRLILGGCLRLSHQVVTVSDSIRDMAAQKFPSQKDKLILISNGVDQHFLDIGARCQRTSSQALRLITIASLIPSKGINQIIQAASLLKDKINFNLTIVGSGPEKEKLRKLTTSLGLGEKVYFTDQVAPDKIPEYLAKADVLVLASYSEGRPNVLLEAMAANVPIVATNIPGVSEMVQHGKTGLLFPPEAVEILADQLRRLAQDHHLRRQLAHNARKFIFEQGLLWTQTGFRYAEIYQQSLLAPIR